MNNTLVFTDKAQFLQHLTKLDLPSTRFVIKVFINHPLFDKTFTSYFFETGQKFYDQMKEGRLQWPDKPFKIVILSKTSIPVVTTAKSSERPVDKRKQDKKQVVIKQRRVDPTISKPASGFSIKQVPLGSKIVTNGKNGVQTYVVVETKGRKTKVGAKLYDGTDPALSVWQIKLTGITSVTPLKNMFPEESAKCIAIVNKHNEEHQVFTHTQNKINELNKQPFMWEDDNSNEARHERHMRCLDEDEIEKHMQKSLQRIALHYQGLIN